MNIFKSFLSSLFVSSLLIAPVYSFAVEPVKTTAPVSPVTLTGQSVLVSEVNLTDGRIMSQDGNTFNIAFSISNGKGLQTGVKYRVQLIPDGGKYIADEKAYEESVTLYENTTEKREIVYVAPSQFSGSYNLFINSSNENDFPFGMESLGKVKLTASTKSVVIDNSSCYLQVDKEKGAPKYTPMQYVDISDEEVLKLTCTATNGTAKDD